MLRFLSNKELKPFVAAHVRREFSLRAQAGGLLNQNAVVTAGHKRFLLKVYRPKLTMKDVGETHRVMAFAAARGIPVPLPVADGIVEGHVVALYPFVAGSHPPRYKNPRTETLGDMLGRIDAVLDDFRPAAPRPTPRELTHADVPSFLQRIADLRASLASRSAADRAYVGRALDGLERVVREVPWQDALTDDLPVRACHNDFHTQNVLMDGNRITAVLDWEKAGWQFRGFEAMRSVIFNCRSSSRAIDWDAADAYLHAYAKHVRLTARERETAFLCGLREMTFSLWIIRQYLDGHAAVRGNVMRRTQIVEYLAAHREKYATRVAQALR